MKKTPLKLQEKHYDERRRSIKRLLAVVLAITVAIILAGLWASLRHRTKVAVAPVLPENASRQLSGYTFTRSEEGRQIFTIHAARTLGYHGARTVLEGVHVIVYGRRGNRHDEISADRCQYNDQTGALACSGAARVQLEPNQNSKSGPGAKESERERQPFLLDTSNVTYNPQHSTVKTRDEVSFLLGTASGHAQGLAYNTRTGNLKLNRDVSFGIPVASPGASKQSAAGCGAAKSVRLFAGGLVYDRRANQITFHSPVSLTQSGCRVAASGGQVFLNANNEITRLTLASVRGEGIFGAGDFSAEADHFEAEMNPATGQIRQLSASGHLDFEDRRAGSGSLTRLSANHIAVAMAGRAQSDHRRRPDSKPQILTAEGHVELVSDETHPPAKAARLPNKRLPPGQRVLTSQKLLLKFGPGGLLKFADTAGPGMIRFIPTSRLLDRQSISAGDLQMAFDASGRPKTIIGSASTRIVDQPSDSASSERISSADHLIAQIDPTTGLLTGIQQAGHYRFQQGSRKASASEATYDAAKQKITLTGDSEIWDSRSRVRARRIVMNLAAETAEGWGNVQSVYSDAAGVARAADSAEKSPAREPIIIVADRVSVNRRRQTAHYQGNVRAWRGADIIETPSLELDRERRRFTAGPGVITSLVQQAPAHGAKTQGGAEPPVTIRADRLHYFDLGRKAVYQGNVRMVSGKTTFRADRVDVYFAKNTASGGAQVERATADGSVVVTQLPGRRATAEHAEYFAAAGKIVLTGGPPAVFDRQQGYLSGKRLTFFIHDASLFADGGNQSQTVSKRRVLKP